MSAQMQSDNYNMLDEPRSMLDAEGTELETMLNADNKSTGLVNQNSLKKHALLLMITRSNEKAEAIQSKGRAFRKWCDLMKSSEMWTIKLELKRL